MLQVQPQPNVGTHSIFGDFPSSFPCTAASGSEQMETVGNSSSLRREIGGGVVLPSERTYASVESNACLTYNPTNITLTRPRESW